MPRDAEQAIASAIQRGAIRPERAAHYRNLVAEGMDPAVIDDLAAVLPPQPIIASGPARAAVYRDVAAAGAPPGADPVMYASNPILVEMERDKPALVAA